MAGTILGKRYRAYESSTSNGLAASSTRASRRTRIVIHQDTNVETTPAEKLRSGTRKHELDTDHASQNDNAEDEDSRQPAKKRSRLDIALAKLQDRIALSPRKDNGQAQTRFPSETRSSPLKHEIARTCEDDEDTENVTVQLPTPKTPRHRDALSKKVPVTPRHRIGLVGQPLTPRSLHSRLSEEKVPSIFARARQLFTGSAAPGRLVGRNVERETLKSFLQRATQLSSDDAAVPRIKAASSVVMDHAVYISGPPGTGKSAAVREVCDMFEDEPNVRIGTVNCMGMKKAGDLASKLCDLLFDVQLGEISDPWTNLRKAFGPSRGASQERYVVVLDEIDHLLGFDIDTVYSLFELAREPMSSLTIIGIANALDLTDRFLPLLKVRKLKPTLLPFLPYTPAQITEVITQKLFSLAPGVDPKDLKSLPMFQPAAIQLCAKKVAAQSGDLRKAFDIIRRSLDVVELETQERRRKESAELALDDSPSRANPLTSTSNTCEAHALASPSVLTALTAPRVTIAHVSRVSAGTFSNGTQQRLRALNLQQKAALCALIAHRKGASSATSKSTSNIFSTPRQATSATLRRLHETYTNLCKRENQLHPLTVTEFADVLGGLETMSLVGQDSSSSASSSSGTGFPGLGKSSGKRLSGMMNGETTPSRRGRGRPVGNGGSGSKSGAGAGKVGQLSAPVGNGYEKRWVAFINEKELCSCLDGAGGEILRGLLIGEGE